jgi:hypothetical protein
MVIKNIFWPSIFYRKTRKKAEAQNELLLSLCESAHLLNGFIYRKNVDVLQVSLEKIM